MQVTLCYQFPHGCCAAGSISASAIEKMLLHVCLYGHAIYHVQLMSDGLIFLYVLCHVLFFVWPTLYDTCLELLHVCIFGCCFLFIFYSCTHWQVHCCVYSVNILLRPHIPLFLFPSWLLHDNQSALYSLGLCLYSMHTLY